MSKDARNELITAISGRYRESERNEKRRILDEFVSITGYHRKHTLRVLHRGEAVKNANPVGTRARGFHTHIRSHRDLFAKRRPTLH